MSLINKKIKLRNKFIDMNGFEKINVTPFEVDCIICNFNKSKIHDLNNLNNDKFLTKIKELCTS